METTDWGVVLVGFLTIIGLIRKWWRSFDAGSTNERDTGYGTPNCPLGCTNENAIEELHEWRRATEKEIRELQVEFNILKLKMEENSKDISGITRQAETISERLWSLLEAVGRLNNGKN